MLEHHSNTAFRSRLMLKEEDSGAIRRFLRYNVDLLHRVQQPPPQFHRSLLKSFNYWTDGLVLEELLDSLWAQPRFRCPPPKLRIPKVGV